MDDIKLDAPESILSMGATLAFLSNDFVSGYAADYREVINESILPAPHIDNWLKFYKDSTCLAEEANKAIFKRFQEDKGLQDLIAHLVSELSDSVKIDANEMGNYIKEIFPLYQGSIDLALSLEKTGNLEKYLTISVARKFYKLLNSPPILFFFKVIIPCWILFGQSAHFLFNDAVSGDVDSISKLLKIDKSIIRNEKIANTIFKLSLYSKNSKDYSKIENSFSSRALKRQNKNIKVKIAGLIHILFHSNGYEITFPQIQELFDNAYHSRHPEFLCDPDLPERPDSFAKAVKRANKFWAGLFLLDKK